MLQHVYSSVRGAWTLEQEVDFQKLRALEPAAYRQVFERECDSEGVPFDACAFDSLLADYHARTGRPLLACYPRDLLHLIASRSAYLAVAPALTPELIDWAWHAYFATTPGAPTP